MSGTNEVRTVSSTGGAKGQKDERYDLIPAGPLAEVARLYGIGARKYASNNWRKGYEASKSFQAMMRHAWAWWRGENLDAETGCSHMASVVFHAFALFELLERHPHFDDRFNEETGRHNNESDLDEVGVVGIGNRGLDSKGYL